MNPLEIVKLAGPAAALIAGGGFFLYKTIYSVEGGHRAIKFSRFTGLSSKYYREGWHLKIPYFERPIIYDIRTHYVNNNAVTGSKDLQTVKLTIRVLYRPMEDKLPELYRLAGTNYANRVLPSLINEVSRIIVVSYSLVLNRLNTMRRS